MSVFFPLGKVSGFLFILSVCLAFERKGEKKRSEKQEIKDKESCKTELPPLKEIHTHHGGEGEKKFHCDWNVF